jgi:hypothetical protein
MGIATLSIYSLIDSSFLIMLLLKILGTSGFFVPIINAFVGFLLSITIGFDFSMVTIFSFICVLLISPFCSLL